MDGPGSHSVSRVVVSMSISLGGFEEGPGGDLVLRHERLSPGGNS